MGQFERGITHSLGVFLVTFFVLFFIVSGTNLGIREFSVSPDEPMLFVRPGILTAMALVGLLGVRREKIQRFGLFPEPIQTVVALLFAGLIGFGAMHLAKFPIAADSNFMVVIGLLAFRAIGEG